MSENEVWKKIKGFSRYEISNLGRIRNEKKFMSQRKNDDGYMVISLYNDDNIRKTSFAHNFLYYTYYDKIEDYSVDHKNRIRDDNRLENLIQVSKKEQSKNRRIIKDFNNGRKVIRICPTTNKTLEEYDSLSKAQKWVKLNTTYKGSAGLICTSIKRNKKVYNFIWKYKEDENKDEIWKIININKFKELWDIINIDNIKIFDGYFISNKGRLKKPSGQILNGFIQHGYLKYGYVYANILTACVFIKNEDPLNKNIVHHIDHEKLNNSIDNLIWVSQSENLQFYHKFKIKNRSNIIQYNLNNDIIKVFDNSYTIPMIAKELNIGSCAIRRCLNNKIKTEPKKFIFKYEEQIT
tara:strand:+ start:982 stop:2034 length:1053 start_codon:yes stop_codon:yes gene_type:complete